MLKSIKYPDHFFFVFLQASGLGGMKPNTLVLGKYIFLSHYNLWWPYDETQATPIKALPKKVTAGFSILFFLFFFIFSQFNQVAQLLICYKSRLELKRGGWVLAQIDTVKFASFSLYGLKNNSSHGIVMQGRQRNLVETRKAKDLTFCRLFWE